METKKQIEARRAQAATAEIISEVKNTQAQVDVRTKRYSWAALKTLLKIRCPECGKVQFAYESSLSEAVYKCNECGIYLKC